MLGQLETAIVDKLMVYGPLGAIAIFVFLALRYYGPKVIDGLITLLKEFLQNLSLKLDRMVTSSERQAESTEQLTEIGKRHSETLQFLCEQTKTHYDAKGAKVYEQHIFSTVDTNKALRLMCQAKVLETSNEAARQLIDEAIRVLTPKQG